MPVAKSFKTVAQWLVVAGALAYFGNSQYRDYLSKRELDAANEREIRAMVESLHRLATTHGATVGWAQKISGKDAVRLSPIMSAELQQVWLTGAPVLFVGALKDISRNEDGSYLVHLQYTADSSEFVFLSTEIHLKAKCAAEQTLPLLKMARDTSRMAIFADSAIVGTISEVSSKQVRDSEGADITQLTGTATCLGTQVLAHWLPSNWASQSPEK